MAQAYVTSVQNMKEKMTQQTVPQTPTAEVDFQEIVNQLTDGFQLSQNIFLDNKEPKLETENTKKSIGKNKGCVSSSTKIKARNVLTNLSYNRFGEQDFKKKSFIVDVTSFIIQYLNLFGVDRKLETLDERKQVSFIWQKCLPADLMHYLTFRENYIIISSQNLNFQKCFEIVGNYLNANPGNYLELQRYIETYFTVLRYVFSILFSKIYSRINLNGIETKSKFDFSFFEWQNETLNSNKQTAKDTSNYANDKVVRNENEQTPILDFHVVKQEEIVEETDSSSISTPVKPSYKTTPKQKFDSERAQRRQEKQNTRKRQLEEQLAENTKQLNLLKPAAKMSRKLIVK